MRPKFSMIILLTLALSAGKTYAQTTVSRIDTFLNNLNADHQINGSVLVAAQGKVLYDHSYGIANVHTHQVNAIDTKYVMASVSKPLTAIAVFQLIEKGKLKLDEPVARYLPTFSLKDITVRNLLAHTSGLPNTEELFGGQLKANPDKQYTNADILPALVAFGTVRFRAGEKYEYSNTNYSLLALLIEKQTGRAFADYMRRYVFKPAGMANTEIIDSDFNFPAGFAKKYDRPIHYADTLRLVTEVPEIRQWTYNWVGFQGPGNMVSTTHDLLNLDRALYAGKLVSARSMDLMFTPNKLNDGSIPYFRAGIDEAAYGLGWFIFRHTDNGRVVWHSGGIPGMNTFLLRNIEKKQLVITMDNAQNAPVAPELYIILSNKPFFRGRSLARLYVTTLLDKGADRAQETLNRLKTDKNWTLSEGELNFLGIELMNNKHLTEALEVFKTNTILFPDSFNTYDSYGEALMKAGRKEEAIEMYKKSIKLNPGNQSGKKMLEKLLGEP
ncbi:tetratricopeptide repeat protein [Mucilaginibacter conchicola]|uniref:Tetratricopeptide repeat protein n=1 Tax=Mucilaginibacter conchicola TaxID=2303333 RepID=A0A372NQX9_9SPHI|nr:serine hydrolase [Mucilaginibacter conchicola]RFZ91344.1 tetratricopeptide repeat protein [Mucilaginibacter conchicola]